MSEEDTTTKLLCSFCEKSQTDVSSLIKGPGENICNECVALCNTQIEECDFIDSSRSKASCSFCSKTDKIVNRSSKSANGFICAECIDLCNEILQDQQWKQDGFAFCSFFCRKTVEQVAFIVKGPSENICNECVQLFSSMFEEKPVRSSVFRNCKCAFCGVGGDETHLAGLGNFICENCLEICKQEIEENSDKS